MSKAVFKAKSDNEAKYKMMDAALDFFYQKGFHQTTVREIARAAGVNQALISYYFGSKKGLLEELMIRFYEGYFRALQEHGQMDSLLPSLRTCFDYLFDRYLMTRFIYRELTLDSTLIREVMTTYLAREKYYYVSIVEEERKNGFWANADAEMLVLQLLNMLYMPFLQPQLIREVYYVEPHADEFKERYWLQLEKWIRQHRS